MAPRSAPSDLSQVPRLRLVFGARAIVGPGRADLLEGIRETGSLAGAGRRMAMSYKRAWTLVEELNGTFDEPLVEMSRGGREHGGAALTALGTEILDRYRRMQAASDAAIAQDLAAMSRRVAAREDADMSDRK